MAPSSEAWALITEWHLVLPPSRPSLHHLAFFSKYLLPVDRSAPIAILGSTPEFRDLLCRLGFLNIYIFEKYKSVYHHLTGMRAYSSPENLVEGDWLDTLPHFQSYFSAILSDLTSGNVPYEKRGAFYSAIATSLLPDGYFLDKLLIHTKRKPTAISLLAKYDHYPVNLLYTNYFSCELLFCSDLLDRDQIVDTTVFYDILQPLCVTPVLSRFLHDAHHITPSGARWYYGRPWESIQEVYDRCLFQIEEDGEEPTSPYHSTLRLRASRPRRSYEGHP